MVEHHVDFVAGDSDGACWRRTSAPAPWRAAKARRCSFPQQVAALGAQGDLVECMDWFGYSSSHLAPTRSGSSRNVVPSNTIELPSGRRPLTRRAIFEHGFAWYTPERRAALHWAMDLTTLLSSRETLCMLHIVVMRLPSNLAVKNRKKEKRTRSNVWSCDVACDHVTCVSTFFL